MEKFLFSFRFLLLTAILILGFSLRSDNLYTWPRTGSTFDEYAWTWLGISLIKEHVPQSWSRHPQYTDRKDIIYQKTAFVLVKPYLEHPPLFGLVAGSYALLTGTNNMFDVTVKGIRGLSLILGTFSIFMVYIFANQLYGANIALLSSLIYSTVPTIVVGSRIVQNENFFTPFFLLSLFLIARYIKTGKSWLRNLSAVICGLLTLAKVPWFAAGISIFLVFLFLKRYRDAIKFMAIIVPIFLLFFIYGFYFDPKLFLNLWQLQLGRYDLAFNSVFALFTSPYLVDRFMVDGWIYFGWFAFFLVLARDLKKNYMLILPLLSYFAIYIFAIPNEPGHGWYRYPFYPFLVLGIALFLKEYFSKNYLLTFFFLIFIGLSLLHQSFGQSFGFSYLVFRIFLLFFGLSLLPYFIPKTNKISRASSYISLFLLFLLNIWSVLNYNEQ